MWYCDNETSANANANSWIKTDKIHFKEAFPFLFVSLSLLLMSKFSSRLPSLIKRCCPINYATRHLIGGFPWQRTFRRATGRHCCGNPEDKRSLYRSLWLGVLQLKRIHVSTQTIFSWFNYKVSL